MTYILLKDSFDGILMKKKLSDFRLCWKNWVHFAIWRYNMRESKREREKLWPIYWRQSFGSVNSCSNIYLSANGNSDHDAQWQQRMCVCACLYMAIVLIKFFPFSLFFYLNHLNKHWIRTIVNIREYHFHNAYAVTL